MGWLGGDGGVCRNSEKEKERERTRNLPEILRGLEPHYARPPTDTPVWGAIPVRARWRLRAGARLGARAPLHCPEGGPRNCLLTPTK